MICGIGIPCAGANSSPCIGADTSGIAVLLSTNYAAAPRSGPCRPHRDVGQQNLEPTADVCVDVYVVCLCVCVFWCVVCYYALAY